MKVNVIHNIKRETAEVADRKKKLNHAVISILFQILHAYSRNVPEQKMD